MYSWRCISKVQRDSNIIKFCCLLEDILYLRTLRQRWTKKHLGGNTRLSDNSRIRVILEFLLPHYLHRSATVHTPAIRLLRLASVVVGKRIQVLSTNKLMQYVSIL